MLLFVILQIILITKDVNIVKNEVRALLSISTDRYELAIMNNKRYRFIGKRYVKHIGMIEDSIDGKTWEKIIKIVNALKEVDLKDKELSKVIRIDDVCYDIKILLNESIERIFICKGNKKASVIIQYINYIMDNLHLYDKYIGKKFHPAKLLVGWKCPVKMSKVEKDIITVVMWLIVSKKGKVKEIKNISSNNKKILDLYKDDIIKCAKNLKFIPAFIDNVPIESDFLLTIKWSIYEQDDTSN